MRKDINLLYSLTQSTKKKNSSTRHFKIYSMAICVPITVRKWRLSNAHLPLLVQPTRG